MSEILVKQNTKITKLKDLILRLHNGEDEQKVKEAFIRDFKYVSGAEIAQMEQQLVNEGMSIDEIMSLCDVHASLFQDNLEDLHSDKVTHPFDYFREDNEFLTTFMHANQDHLSLAYVQELYDRVDDHYGKKEQLLFPLLEYVDILTIPQVMWGVDNEIRAELKVVISKLASGNDAQVAYVAVEKRIRDMITKEQNVLFQMLEEHLSSDLWDKLDLALKNNAALQLNKPLPKTTRDEVLEGYIQLPSGKVNALELEKILNVLPLDITFVDKHDRVAYVSQGKHRVFDRPLTVLGREVKLCHPPQSVHIVEAILDDFKAKRKREEHFWIPFKGMFVYIQYFAIYDNEDNYLGVVEVSQDISGIQSIRGEKRLAD
ncbi:MAG: DUF438 domain-containing protein [Breznakia sp.]